MLLLVDTFSPYTLISSAALDSVLGCIMARPFLHKQLPFWHSLMRSLRRDIGAVDEPILPSFLIRSVPIRMKKSCVCSLRLCRKIWIVLMEETTHFCIGVLVTSWVS